MQEPTSPDFVLEETMENVEQCAEPSPAPVEMETENVMFDRELEHSPLMEHKNDSPVTIFSSPNVAKSMNNSLDVIMIESEESSPIAAENKENLEPKIETDDHAAIIKSLKKVIFNLKTKNSRDISIAKKNTRRDVVDKMSANHKLSLSKERKNHLKLLRETKELYEKRLSDVEKFYMEKIAVLEDNRTVAFDALLETKCTLEEQIKKSSDSLNNIINMISMYPSHVTTCEMQPLPIAKNLEKKVFTSMTENTNFDRNANDSKNSDKIAQMETEVYEQKLRITCLENKIKDEITSKGQIQQKLAYTELLYRTTIREKDEMIKNLQDELNNSKNSKNEMENRHKEQFLKYDRMLKRSEAEIAVQKREVLALRTQFVPGTPTNFNPYKGTPSMIKESTPSSSKVSSNITFFDASGTKKAPLFNESTPSYCTAASSRSSQSGAISNQTPSSKASKSLRSTKAPSENSTNSSSARFLYSDDSEEPIPKSTRVLRNRRKRAVKSKKGL